MNLFNITLLVISLFQLNEQTSDLDLTGVTCEQTEDENVVLCGSDSLPIAKCEHINSGVHGLYLARCTFKGKTYDWQCRFDGSGCYPVPPNMP